MKKRCRNPVWNLKHTCLSVFDLRYKNDGTGAPAYDPAILLKIILYAYSRGITRSRQIAQCCKENVVFMALSADTQPHFTTIADFISTANEEVIRLFLEVLMVCDEMGETQSEPDCRQAGTQWLLYCIVHNLTKVHRYAEGFA